MGWKTGSKRREAASTRRAHAAYCLVLAEEGAAEVTDAEGTKWLDLFEIEMTIFAPRSDWLIESGDADWGLRIGLPISVLGDAGVSSQKAGHGWENF